jgi:uncharacterized OsmC-like protein
MTGTVTSHSRTEIAVRDVTSVIDEPLARGGNNTGPTPTETFLSALLGCTNVVSHRIAAREGVTFGAMTITLRAEFDRRGAAIEAPVDVLFPLIEMDAKVATDASQAKLDFIASELAKIRPIAVVLRAAGTEIRETWTPLPL